MEMMGTAKHYNAHTKNVCVQTEFFHSSLTFKHASANKKMGKKALLTILSSFFPFSSKMTSRDRNLSKLDDTIKLEGSLPSFSIKWIKWGQSVI